MAVQFGKPGRGKPWQAINYLWQAAKVGSRYSFAFVVFIFPKTDISVRSQVASLLMAVRISGHGRSVWTGRALQVESNDLEKLVLRICIRPIHGAFELLAIMDIRARPISFAPPSSILLDCDS
jgi:hypothetical protein